MIFTTYREFLEESSIPREFEIEINDTKYIVKRTVHLTQFRKGDNKPRDFKMTKNKYQYVLSAAFNKIKDDKVTTITWVDKNKNNAIVISFKDNIFNIISAVHNSDKDRTKILDKSPNIIHV